LKALYFFIIPNIVDFFVYKRNFKLSISAWKNSLTPVKFLSYKRGRYGRHYRPNRELRANRRRTHRCNRGLTEQAWSNRFQKVTGVKLGRLVPGDDPRARRPARVTAGKNGFAD
jgi:transposase